MYLGTICVSNTFIEITKVLLIFNKKEKTTENLINKYKIESFANLLQKSVKCVY